MLYPEMPVRLNRVKDQPSHRLFKKYGESMPVGDWNHPGTKQGIYMMGPDGEYLEGAMWASGKEDKIRDRLERALWRWDALRKEKGYENRLVPQVEWSRPPGFSGELVLRVNIRDLPRGPGDKSGARFHELPGNNEAYPAFLKWTWNENWIGLPSARAFVPSGAGAEEVDATVVRRICQEVLVDNARGGAPVWEAKDVRHATIAMRRLGSSNGVQKIAYAGRMLMSDGTRTFDASLYGEGMWNEQKGAFESIEIVVIGTRYGGSRYNHRENDIGPAPMGVTLSLRVH